MKTLLKKLLGGLWLLYLGAMPLCVMGKGFTVTQQNLTLETFSLSEAISASKNPSLCSGSPVTKTYQKIAFENNEATSGEHSPNFNGVSFPGNVGGKHEWFTVEVKGKIYIPSAGNWTFACGSDDGFSCSIAGSGFSDSFSYEAPRSYETSLKCMNIPRVGVYSITILYYERGERAVLDFSVAKGSHSSFSSAFKLVGTEASGIVLADDAYINLNASSNLDDRIKLSWDVPSVMFGVRYYIDRRGSEKEVFQCLNKDNPTREMHYDDRDCLPDVNYYYRVRSESGIESNHVVGNRVAKTVEPKFQFTLTGTDRPSTRGINNEADVLVAGRVFNLTVSPIDATQNVSLKKIELIGTPTGGAPRQNAHRIIWVSNGTEVPLSAQGLLWVKGRPFPAQSCLTLNATLRAGPGCHGEYQWSVDCEYEQDGKKGTCKAISQSTGMNIFGKNVYFYKYGFDNGVPTEKYWEYDRKKEEWIKVPSKGKIMPNWYTYWKEDGACPGLKSDNVGYRGLSGTIGVSIYDKRCVYIDQAKGCKPIKINIDNWNEKDQWFHLRWDKEKKQYCNVYGIYLVESTVAHEKQHIEIKDRYYTMNPNSSRDLDSDLDTEWCAVKVGEYAKCTGIEDERKCCDYIVDADEINDYFGKSLGRLNLGIKTNDVDTYSIRKMGEGWWSYGAYGDNELVARVAGEGGTYNAKPKKDWAYPGEQSGGIPEDAVLAARPLPKSTRLQNAKQSGVLGLLGSSSDEQTTTNLIITINSIAVDAQRDQNCVTGIVYTIGVSIQGDDLVDFNGYLVDAQSNVVATAISAANAESDSVELFFDSRNIFDNYNGGPLTLGRVDLTVVANYSTNNVIGTLYDFAVEPIEVNKSELLCNKGYILDEATTNDVSASGITVSIPVLVNVADDYRLEAELVNTNDELVATAFATNYCVTGTNVFALTFSSDAIYQNGRSGIHAVKNVQLWCGDEMIDANAMALELTENRDIADFVPSGISVVVDSSSGRFLEPTATPDGKLSSVEFVFDVTNATDAMVGYDVASVLMNTNSEIVASIRTAVAVTNGLNQVVITVPASAIAKSGVNGPYRFESIELLPQGESSCGTTYRPSALSAAYTASDFGASAIEPCGTPRLVDTPDGDRLTVEYFYDALRVGRVVAEIVLADKNGDFAARVVTTNDVSEVGIKTNSISIASDSVAGGITNSPYAVACLSLTPDIIGESSVYIDTESLTNIFWQVAAPVFSPATKTVFFRSEQPVVISCATDAAEIHYTLDGSEPTVDSALYDGSLAVTNSVTVKAKAFAENMRPSETVQAEYVHASIVGDNLVQNTSPEAGVAQTVSVPVPGKYQVSFDWTQGGDFELRLSKGGDVRTVAAISAETAGTTNVLFDVSEVGNYELMVFDPSAGVSQSAGVSNLSMSIPDTPESKGQYWIYETESTYGYTGDWVGGNGFRGGKMPITEKIRFNPYTSSNGDRAEIIITIEFEEAVTDDILVDAVAESSDYKVVVTMGTDVLSNNVFKVLTEEQGKMVWKDVHAEGLGAPVLGTPYTFKFVLDCASSTYSVSLAVNGKETPLTDGTTGAFGFPGSRNSIVNEVVLQGGGAASGKRNASLVSLFGEYGGLEADFAAGDALPVSDGTVDLTDGQAGWLNSMGSPKSVRAKAGAMEMENLMLAYLLNLDLTKDGFGLVEFKVTEIDVGDTVVRIKVQLDRTGTMQTGEGGETRSAPINGILKLYGGELPNDCTILNATGVTNADFGDGDSATFTYPRSEGARFFRCVIEVPSN